MQDHRQSLHRHQRWARRARSRAPPSWPRARSIRPDKVATPHQPDALFLDEIRKAGLYDSIWQAFAVLLLVKTVGAMGDARPYESVLVLRAVTSTDGMTADVFEFPWEVLTRAETRIVNEVGG